MFFHISDRKRHASATLREQGFSVVELMATLVLIALMTSVAAINLRQLDNPLQDGTAQLVSFMKQARAKAVATTSGYFVRASSASRIVADVGENCADLSPTPDTDLVLDLPDGVILTDTAWAICLDARGFADDNITITLTDGDKSRDLEVFLGGAIRETL
jgi:prepilin-type N-terminal cleavage/methylation domain-containing protein